MSVLVTTIHVLTCLALILVVLLQHGRGADIGAAFGAGASQTVFGGRGAGDFLTRLTTGAAIVFMLTSLTLSYFIGNNTLSELVPDEAPPIEAPIEPESSFPEAAPISGSGEEQFEEIPDPSGGAEPAAEAPPPAE